MEEITYTQFFGHSLPMEPLMLLGKLQKLSVLFLRPWIFIDYRRLSICPRDPEKKVKRGRGREERGANILAISGRAGGSNNRSNLIPVYV